MAMSIYICFPDGEHGHEGPIRGDMEWDLEEFFGPAADSIGGSAGKASYTLDYDLVDGEDVEAWTLRLQAFLQEKGVGSKTFFDLFLDTWVQGQPWRRIEVYGSDHWLTEWPVATIQ